MDCHTPGKTTSTQRKAYNPTQRAAAGAAVAVIFWQYSWPVPRGSRQYLYWHAEATTKTGLANGCRPALGRPRYAPNRKKTLKGFHKNTQQTKQNEAGKSVTQMFFGARVTPPVVVTRRRMTMLFCRRAHGKDSVARNIPEILAINLIY